MTPTLIPVDGADRPYGRDWHWTDADGVTVISSPAIMILDESIAALPAGFCAQVAGVRCAFEMVEPSFGDQVDADALRAELLERDLISAEGQLTEKAHAVMFQYRRRDDRLFTLAEIPF
jgi:hypothetical protein